MNRGRYILGFGLMAAVWCMLTYFSYQKALHSILPLDDTLLLPSFVFPAGLAFLYLAHIWLALTVKPRAELLDPQATVVIRAKPVMIGVRFLLYVAWSLSAAWAMAHPAGLDGPYANPTYMWILLAIGVWGLVSTFSVPRIALEISPMGIRHTQIKPALIPWSDVTEIKLKRWLLSQFVLVIFRPETDYHLARMLWQWRKIPRLTMSPFGFGVDADTLLRALQLRRDLHILD